MFTGLHTILSPLQLIVWLTVAIITGIVAIEPNGDNWGYTRIHGEKISYTWIISNYSLNHLEFEEYLKSPIFSGSGNSEYQWQLSLYPKGAKESEKNNVGLFLYLVNKVNETADCTLSLIDANGEKEASTSFTYKFTDTATGYGSYAIVSQANLKDKTKNLLPDDRLTVLAEIVVKTGVTTVSGQCTIPNRLSGIERTAMLLENSFLSDLTLLASDKTFDAHRAILAVHSSYFLEKFQNDPKLHTITINNASSEAVRETLRFIYTGKIKNLEILATELLDLSNRLGIEKLKATCEEALCKSMKPENATELLVLAGRHDANNLELQVSNYIAAHAGKVIDSPGFKVLENSYPNPFYGVFRSLFNRQKV